MSILNIQLLCRKSKKKIPKVSPFASWLGTIINPQWLEPPMSWTIFYGPKDVRAIEVRLYFTNGFCLTLQRRKFSKILHFILDKWKDSSSQKKKPLGIWFLPYSGQIQQTTNCWQFLSFYLKTSFGISCKLSP